MEEIKQDEGPKQMLIMEKKANGGWLIKINPSSLTLLQTCPKKSYYSLYKNLVPLKRSDAVLFGSAIHKALEIYYSAPREKRRVPPNMKDNINLMCHGQRLADESSSIIYRATRGFIECAAPLADLPNTDKRSLSNGGWLLGEYFEDRVYVPLEVMFRDGEPLVEKLLETEIFNSPELTIKLFGTIDAILINRSTEQVVICDHKTSSVVGNDFYNRTKPNHQYTAYVHLAQQELGLSTENFMINCFQVKARPKTTRGKGPDFLHLITKRTPRDISDFILTTIYYVRQYISWVEEDFFPYGPVDACANYGRCSFLDVCSVPETIKESIL